MPKVNPLKPPATQEKQLTYLKAIVDLNNSCNSEVDSTSVKDEDPLVSAKEASHLDYDR